MLLPSFAVCAVLSSASFGSPGALHVRVDDADVRALTHEELTSAIAAIASEHPDVASVHRIGTSREGRAIDALRLTAAPEPEAVPAMLLIANLEGPRVFESGVVLHHAAALADAYASDDAVRTLLDTTVVWFVPRANPDAAEGRFAAPAFERWATTLGIDDDRDGRQGEDPPSDVNGDGIITKMRALDPDGTWIEDPTDPRVLVEADRKKGERGKWKLYTEGRDLDGDDAYAEDAPGDARVDRNFASGWEAHTAEAGLFPTDDPESRALCEFVMANKNLVLVVAYDGQDNLVEKPKSVADDAPPVKRVPKEGVLQSDADLITELGRRYREATENDAKGSGVDAGTFTRWCYDHRGLWVLQAVLWDMPTEAPKEEAPAEEADGADADGAAAADAGDAVTTDASGDDAGPKKEGADEGKAADEGARGKKGKKSDEPKPSTDAQHLSWIDGAGESWRFVDWTPFEHPELGPVEIGGFAPYARIEPPKSEWSSIAETHLAWFEGIGELLPRVSIAECTKEKLGDGVWKVSVVLENDAYLPLLSRSMMRTRTTRPARVDLVLPEAGKILSGLGTFQSSDLPGSGGRFEASWLVHGPDDMEVGVSVDTDHAGSAFRKAEVKQ